MLDHRQYDEAIQYFAELAQKDSHYQVKLAWASAYAARAGVKIENIYNFVTARPGDIPTLNLRTTTSYDQQVAELLRNLARYSAVWAKIPSVSKSAREDLQSAVNVLRGEEIPGVHLYSATLQAVILKSVVDEGVRNWNLSQKKRICLHDIKPYWNWALSVLAGIEQFSIELEGAFPSKKELTEARKNIHRVREQAQSITLPEEDQCF